MARFQAQVGPRLGSLVGPKFGAGIPGGPLLALSDGTFDRNSAAYALGSDGLLDQYAVDELRTEHRSDLGLYLLEGERTNRLTRSEEFGHANWSNSATVTANTDVAPDGAQTADTVEDNDGGANQFLRQSVTLGAASTHVFSIFVKKDDNESRFPEFQLSDQGSTEKLFVQLNTKTGATTIRDSTGTVDVDILEVPDGWWRLSMTLGFGSTSARVQIYPALGTSLGGTEGTTGSIVCWGAQLEQGAFPSSYIKTTTGGATRVADTLTFAGDDVPERIRSGKWSVDWRPSYANNDISNRRSMFQEDGNQLNGVRFRPLGATGNFEFIGASGLIVAATGVSFSRHQKITLTFDQQAGSLTIEGATSGNGTYTGTPDPWDPVDMDFAGTNGLNDQGFGGLSNLRAA